MNVIVSTYMYVTFMYCIYDRPWPSIEHNNRMAKDMYIHTYIHTYIHAYKQANLIGDDHCYSELFRQASQLAKKLTQVHLPTSHTRNLTTIHIYTYIHTLSYNTPLGQLPSAAVVSSIQSSCWVHHKQRISNNNKKHNLITHSSKKEIYITIHSFNLSYMSFSQLLQHNKYL